jgi:hypothetical protein
MTSLTEFEEWEAGFPPLAPKVNRFYPAPKSARAQARLAYRLNMLRPTRTERRAAARRIVRQVKRSAKIRVSMTKPG